MNKLTFFCLRYPAQMGDIVSAKRLLGRVNIERSWGGEILPGSEGLNIARQTREVNLWTSEPNAIKGIIADHNAKWDGLQIRIAEERKQD